MKFLLCVVLVAAGAIVQAQKDYGNPDYWENDYEDVYDFNYPESNENTELKEIETNQQEEVQDVKEIQEPDVQDSKEFDNMQDYQIEDNRSNANEKEVEANKVAVTEKPVVETDLHNDDLSVLPLEQPGDTKQTEPPQQSNEDETLDIIKDPWDAVDNDEPLPVQSAVDNKDILEETKNILNEDSGNFEDQADKDSQAETLKAVDELSDLDKILEETNRLLEESDDAFEPNDYDNSDEQDPEKSNEYGFENNDNFEEDTPEKVYADLNADIDKLFETLDKLSADSSDEDDETNEDSNEDDAYVNNVQDYEDKFGKPYNEDVALSWRNAEVDDVPDESEEVAKDENSEAAQDDEVSAENNDDNAEYEDVDDSNLSQIFAEHAEFEEQEQTETKTTVNDVSQETTPAPKDPEVDDYNNNYDDEVEPNADDEIDSVIRQIFTDDIKEPQSYGNDALTDEKQPKENDAAEFETMETNNTNVEENIERKSVMVDELTSAELSDLMTQFVAAHNEDLDVNSDSFAKHVAPIHITLSVDEPTVITSPEYPSPYPTNNIVDWVFDGPGTGIELNITDFAVNGAIGDYLLVKPGGLDESGQDGLIFSYRLTSERRYRFADVNRMFVRFEAKPGWQFMTGFSFSVKLIWPLPQVGEDIPEPEAVLEPPQETLTLNLAGLSLQQFHEIEKEFIDLLADMANAYILDHDIDRGLNTTSEVTQITRTAICNIQWPDHDTCVEVTFGVPLQYEDDDEEPRLNAQDLDVMWTQYVIKEEFADRLRLLGITEYAIPNDRTVLMVWLVIAAGVLISMAMLAVALWRFSCFEDYTRMKAYSDTDSIKNEKRHLDLYPTPHQTLPPLYTENDYKWADDKYDDSTRVDMGGFANRSYVRDELFDLDSDEDVITTRDRKGAISPRNLYEV